MEGHSTLKTHKGKMDDFLRVLQEPAELVNKEVGGGHGHVKAENLEDEVLHAQDLAHLVSVVSDVCKLAHIRWVDLFVFPATHTNSSSFKLNQSYPVQLSNAKVTWDL